MNVLISQKKPKKTEETGQIIDENPERYVKLKYKI